MRCRTVHVSSLVCAGISWRAEPSDSQTIVSSTLNYRQWRTQAVHWVHMHPQDE